MKLNDIESTEHKLIYDFEVINIGKDRFYGFSVDKNERYVLYNCIVTYNSNGKSVLTTSLLSKTFGDYFATLEHTVLTRRRREASNATPELADKKGKRLIIMAEPEDDDKIYASFMKQITGGDYLTARALYKECTQYKPQFKLVMVCNDLPEIAAMDGGTWRRVRTVPFESEFVDESPSKKNQFLKDDTIEDKIDDYWREPFIWLLLNKYYPDYLNNGIREPKEVTDRTKKYRKACDMYRDFIESTFEVTKNEDDKIQINTVYTIFKQWFKEAYADSKCPIRKALITYINKVDDLKFIDNVICNIRYKKTTTDNNNTLHELEDNGVNKQNKNDKSKDDKSKDDKSKDDKKQKKD
jgi:P4 family phage/plasmid primase-like protien